MLLAVALCLLCTLNDSQADAGGPPGRRPPPPSHAVAEVRAVRVAQAITVDGMLEEPVWRQAISVSHFTQSDPIEGAQPSSTPTASSSTWIPITTGAEASTSG